MMRKGVLLFVVGFLGCASITLATKRLQFSTAGFYQLACSGRAVYNINPGWRFLKADDPEAWKVDYDDSAWEVVTLSHGLEYLPATGKEN